MKNEYHYPEFHSKIVNELLEGRFLLYSDFQKFQNLKEKENFYVEFFKKTFDYDLVVRNEFAYLSSTKTDESLSRNFTIFLSIICYGLNQETTDFKAKIENGIFSFEEIKVYLENKNFEEVIREIGLDKLKEFLTKLEKRNIIEIIDKNEYNFKFTKAVDLFFEFALQLSKM